MATVAELMRDMLRADPALAAAWLPQLWQFCQVFNLFHLKPVKVNLGYGLRRIVALAPLITEVLGLLDTLSGGDEALAIIKRYVPCYDAGVERSSRRPRTAALLSGGGFKPYLLT